MTAYELQLDLAEEIEKIEKDILLKDVKGNPVHLKAFAQCLPKRIQNVADLEEDQEGDIMRNEDPEEDPYPYCLVRLDSGELKTDRSAQEVATVLVFGIFDDDIICLGHQTILNMMHRVAERFTRNPMLNDKYRMNEAAGIVWVLDDVDRYPYYFGAMYMTWDTFFVGREDEYV